MDVFLLSYANDALNPLPALTQEEGHVYRSLLSPVMESRLAVILDPHAGIDSTAGYITRFREKLTAFSFSGHAEDAALRLDGERALAQGLAHLLGQCARLKFVLLNGCSTAGQVKLLHEKGVKTVIATSAPVKDESARRFAEKFFESLAGGADVRTAFELAVGTVKLRDATPVARSIGDLNLPDDDDASLWGLYCKEENELRYTIPQKKNVLGQPVFALNQSMPLSLWEAMIPYSEKIAEEAAKEKNGERITVAQKRLSITNNLPAPIAEQLRKLWTRETEYDNPGEPRLRQITAVYQSTLELQAFALLAQLWESKLDFPHLEIPEAPMRVLADFFQLKKTQRDTYDFTILIRALRDIYEQSEELRGSFFVEEFGGLRKLMYEDDDFLHAMLTLGGLRKRILAGDLLSDEAADLCLAAEQELEKMMLRLGFLGKYKMLTVKSIDVQKYRHSIKTLFAHQVFRVDLVNQGDLDIEVSEAIMDNRSVLLVKKRKGDKKSEINLSPFVLDAAVFNPGADSSNIYFFHHYDPASGAYFYQDAKKPGDKLLELPVNSEAYNYIHEQWEVFHELIDSNVAA